MLKDSGYQLQAPILQESDSVSAGSSFQCYMLKALDGLCITSVHALGHHGHERVVRTVQLSGPARMELLHGERSA